MNVTKTSLTVTAVLSEDTRLTLEELSTICRVEPAQVAALVVEGALDPVAGGGPHEWRFSGITLRRARLAFRLSRDFDLSPPGVALALDLLDEIEQLRGRLRR